MKQTGFAQALILITLAFMILAGVFFGLKDSIPGLNLSQPSPTPSSTGTKVQGYTQKQLYYLKHKDRIKNELNLSEEQFQLLIEAANNE